MTVETLEEEMRQYREWIDRAYPERRLRKALERIAQAGEIHDPHWAGNVAREALTGFAVHPSGSPESK